MKKITLIISLLALASNSFGQKLYVWCPEEQLAAPRQGFLQNDTIDLVIFDGRILTKKSKVECTSENTIKAIGEIIKQNYPSAFINFISTNDFYKESKLNRITIKISIIAYHAGFGSDIKVGIGSFGGSFSYGVIPEGKWNGITAYSIKVYDKRNNGEIKISKLSSFCSYLVVLSISEFVYSFNASLSATESRYEDTSPLLLTI
jgi:hypothetical protein